MVAKSFQSLELVGEPYVVNGKRYIKVRTKTGSLKQVRWYSESEYAKMYPDDPKVKTHEGDPYYKTQKDVLGFENGFITVFKGNTYEDKEYFKLSKARYTRHWGWAFPSTMEIPEDLPEDVTPVRLDWELVGNPDGTLKSDAEVAAAVDALLCDPDSSEYQGEVGDKLELIVTVEKAIQLDGYYGTSTMHIMRDEDGNCYVWNTSAKSWSAGTIHHITGTIKELKQYKGVKQTVLTRCRVVKGVGEVYDD